MSEMPKTALIHRRMRDAVHAWRWADIPDLLEQGGDPNLVIEGDETLLMRMVSTIENTPQARALLDAVLKKGANIHHQTKAGDGVLEAALCRDHAEILEWLLKNGADPNRPGRSQSPPLQLAVEMDLADETDFRTRLLLAYGAKPDANISFPGQPAQTVRAYLEQKAGLTEVLSATGVVDMADFAYAARKLLAHFPKKPEPLDISRVLQGKAAGKNLKLQPGKPKGPAK